MLYRVFSDERFSQGSGFVFVLLVSHAPCVRLYELPVGATAGSGGAFGSLGRVCGLGYVFGNK